MDVVDNLTVTTADELASHYARPLERVLKKELDHVDALGRAFIAASPFLVLATGGEAGLDCSPKGDQPGFVQVAEDGRSVLIPDRRGNNRLDGLRNIVEDPRVGLIFFIPGANETYRVNGRAQCQRRPGAAAPLRGRRQGAGDGDRDCGRAGVPALPEGARPLRSVAHGRRRPAQGRPDPGRFRGCAQPGHRSRRL